MNIIKKLKKANLKGRGGAGFPTWLKWDMTKKAKGKYKYVVCNAAEGEPGVLKDKYILEHYPKRVIDGMMIAIDFLKAREGIIYINLDYYKIFRKNLEKITKNKPIKLFCKPSSAGYIGGEETSVLNAVEGKRIEPRLRPPFPPQVGLWGMPTLVNNVETFYDVSLIANDEYKHTRFYTIGGDCLWDGVYEFSEDWTIEKILRESKNYPDFDFFVQVGGDASGEVLNSSQLDRPASGAASITIYSLLKHKPINLLKRWINFFFYHSCGQCTACREGTYRLKEAIYSPHPDINLIYDLVDNLSESSFCGLGGAVPIPIKSYLKNVLKGSFNI